MFNVAHVLSPAMVTALSTYFKDLNPKPLGGSKGTRDAEKQSTERESPKATFPRALPVTVQTLKARGISSFSRSALSLRRKGIDGLEQRAESKSG